MRWFFLALTLLWLMIPCRADEIEDWIEDSVNPEELQRWLDDLSRSPLDLNQVTRDDLLNLPFFDVFAARQVLDARHRTGGFRHLKGALDIEGLTQPQRHALERFTVVSESVVRRTQIESRLLGGADGDVSADDPAKWWMRYRGDIHRDDGGSGYMFLKRQPDDPEGFRQVSACVSLVEERTGTQLGFGDFQFESSTGLVFASAFGVSNWLSSPEITAPSRARGLSFRPSADRRSVFRGGAADVSQPHYQATIIGAVSRLDGAVTEDGLERITEGESYSSELLESARRDQVEERLVGGRIQVGGRIAEAGISGYHATYTPEFESERTADPLPRLAGDELRIGSMFVRANAGRAGWVTEIARSRPGGVAAQTAFHVRAERTALCIYHVHADADFYSPRSRVWGGFGEEAANQRSTGVRIRVAWPRHTLLLAAASEGTPFRTSTSPLKKNAGSLETRWHSELSAPASFDVMAGRRWREEGAESSPAGEIRVDRGRADATLRLRDEYRIRFEIRSATSDLQPGHRLGTLLFFQAKMRLSSLVWWGRVTLFDLDGDDVSMSVFENALRGAYPLVPLSGTGRRAALMVTRRWKWGATAAKIAHVHRTSNDERIGCLEFTLGFTYRN